MKITDKQITAIKCAEADLLGAEQAVVEKNDPWMHGDSIHALLAQFDFLETPTEEQQ